MKPIVIVILGATLAASSIISYRSGRFFPGFWIPISLFALYLIMWSLRASGWQLDGLISTVTWAIAIMFTFGIPIGLISAIGANLGVTLSNRSKAKKIEDHTD